MLNEKYLKIPEVLHTTDSKHSNASLEAHMMSATKLIN